MISAFFVLYPTTFTIFVLTFRKKSIKPEAWRIDLFASFLPPFPFTTKLSKSPSFFSLETAGAFAERKKKILQCLSKAEEAFSASLHFKDAMMVYFKKGFLRIYSDLRRLFFPKKELTTWSTKLPMTSLLMAFYFLLCIESHACLFPQKSLSKAQSLVINVRWHSMTLNGFTLLITMKVSKPFTMFSQG